MEASERRIYKGVKMAKRTNAERDTLRIFFRLTLKNKGLFFVSFIYFVGAIGVNVLVPLFISLTLAGIVTQKGSIEANLIPLITVAIIGVLGNLIGFIALVRFSAKGQYDALELAMTTLLSRSVGFHTNNIGGKLVSNALDYPAAFGRLVDAIYINMIPFAITMIVGISIVFSRSLPMGLALLGITIATIIMILVESYRRSGLRAERKKAQNAMIANLSDTVVNTQAVKTFGQESKELAAHQKLNQRLTDFRLRDWTGTGILGSVRMAVLLGLQIAFIAFIAHLIHQDPSVLGIGIFAFAYTLSLTAKLFDVGTMIRNIEEAFLQADSMTEIIMQNQEITDLPNAKSLKVKKGEIVIDNILFSYSDAQNEKVFEHLTLHIPAGQKVGVVGPSGGGKSTLTRLLLRFDDVTDGVIAIDGQDIKKVTQTSLRQSISYVPQEPLLFHRSIHENIAYGKPNATLKEIKQAAKLAYADEFIDKLPLGYDTIVGERGVKLSGGQRQRIAIARAILKDAPVLILDEATSALDSESEVFIQKALTKLMKGRTTIVIAHRLSTIQKMDRVVVLNNGAITEDGTHQELLGNEKTYAKLWAHQSGGFIED